MARYIVAIYEVHKVHYEIDADNMETAIDKVLFDFEGEPLHTTHVGLLSEFGGGMSVSHVEAPSGHVYDCDLNLIA